MEKPCEYSDIIMHVVITEAPHMIKTHGHMYEQHGEVN